MITSEVTLDMYKKISKIEWFDGDEKFPSIVMKFDEELWYCPERTKTYKKVEDTFKYIRSKL